MNLLNVIASKSDREDPGKWLPFKVHSLDTAGIMRLLFLKWIPDSLRKYIAFSLNMSCNFEKSADKACDFCVFAALLHDIGKLTAAFQMKMVNIDGYFELMSRLGFNFDKIYDADKSPHNIAGEAILLDYGFPKEFSAVIGSHHGKPVHNADDQIKNYASNYFGYNSKNEEQWRVLWKEWINFSFKFCGFGSVEKVPKPDVKVQMILSGLLVMSDWIASNTEYFPLADVDGDIISESECKERVHLAWKKLSLPMCWSVDWSSCNIESDWFKDRFGYDKPNPVQSAIIDTVSLVQQPGIYILEAQMGTGKTEAALAASEVLAGKFGFGGIYFGLPTQATANGLFGRVKNFVECQNDGEKHTIRLAHGMTDLNEEYMALFHGKAADSGDECVIVHEWFEGRKQALLSDFVVATVDQFLLASLKQKHTMLRHLGLSSKIVIIDECHTYDAYMNVYLDSTLRWMGAYKVPVIILSATLPPKRRNELISAYLNTKNVNVSNNNEYPLLTWTSGNEINFLKIHTNDTSKEIYVTKLNESDFTECLSDRLSSGGCAAVVVNTVAYAQKLYSMVSDAMPNNEVICFHSRFVSSDRAEIERNIIKRLGKNSGQSDRNGLIVIGTQVIEQSLDIDFDFMVTELCPMDLLLQRSGRLHRHNGRVRPQKLQKAEIAILEPIEEKSDKIYNRWILMQTQKFLPDKLEIPECIPYLVSKVYGEPESDEERASNEWLEHSRIISDKKTKAKKFCIDSEHLKSKRQNTISSFLDDDAGNDAKAEAAVRDTDESFEVLLMQKSDNDNINYCFLPWYNCGAKVSIQNVPSEEDARAIALQRIRLPAFFGTDHNFDKVHKALDVMPERWRQSGFLGGELLLLLDRNLEAELIGKKLIYSREKGLEMQETEQGSEV
jgi:CRISPR-associated endonuclease/helicase Cas3